MERRSITVRGIVQGVGFRPYVYELATRLGLVGFVRNQAGEVHAEVEGDARALDRFVEELTVRPPRLARIDRIEWGSVEPLGERRFWIEASEADHQGPVFVAPDTATCEDCLRELFDPADRHYRYPFLNCTNCGPRLTIIRGVPYDRARTTMAPFAMCGACRAEYEDPADRRYHAQPVACPVCGPRLLGLDGQGRRIEAPDPLALAIETLRAGRTVAIKGLGGYHLACDAQDETAVAELRRRKHRDEKPLAVMVRDVRAALGLCEADEAEQALLRSSRRPIVLLRRRPDGRLAESVAPGNPYLGVMLPYTPLHHLLMEAFEASPLVMTSGNRSDEPIAYEDDDARERLSGIADLILSSDRPIHLRCDDSVTRVVAGAELPLRRSRGDAPQPLEMPLALRVPTLAVGGQLKSTFALGRGRHAFLSHHLGDLDHYEAYRAFVSAVGHYETLFAFRPERIVHDLHPDYASTRFAWQGGEGVARVGVQHHHAHVASCMADNGLDGPVIGVAFDGTGFGEDGAVWGGEFFTGDYRGFRRAAHLRYVSMPGGDQAVREPWRMAVAYLMDAGEDDHLLSSRVLGTERASARRMVERRLNAPRTSSMGRLFDGIAALAGVRDRVRYEGQAAIELEWLSAGCADPGVFPFEVESVDRENFLVIDIRPLICEAASAVCRGVDTAVIGRRFHSTVREIVAEVCGRLRAQTGLSTVVLSGGVFQNALLTEEVQARLGQEGFQVYRHRRVPPGDGGLSLGQLAIVAALDEGPG